MLRDPRVTSALIGARNVEQFDNALDALKSLSFSPEELAEIDTHAVADAGINLWSASTAAEAGGSRPDASLPSAYFSQGNSGRAGWALCARTQRSSTAIPEGRRLSRHRKRGMEIANPRLPATGRSLP